MIISRHLLANISKAIKNNQKSVILNKNQIKNFKILNIICSQGFIQGYELRGSYIIVTLKQIYYNNLTTLAGKSLSNLTTVKRVKNLSSISAKKWLKLTNLSGSTACYIISTDQGIFDNRNKLFSGGIPLIKAL